jgi:hypothetical protein
VFLVPFAVGVAVSRGSSNNGVSRGESISGGTSPDRVLASAVWSALVGGSTLLIASFVALPPPLLVGAWFLFIASVAGAIAVTAIASRRESISPARAFVRGVWVGVRWIVAFLP